MSCTKCKYKESLDEFDAIAIPPKCPRCGALVRPDVVLFGELIDGPGVEHLQSELEKGFDVVLASGQPTCSPISTLQSTWPNRQQAMSLWKSIRARPQFRMLWIIDWQCQPELQCSVFEYAPAERFDLITCVHGLHYVGFKLRAIGLAASWLVGEGKFVANLDAINMCLSEPGKGHRKILRFLREAGFEYLPAKHLLQRIGHTDLKVPFRYLGANDTAGPNYTKQPVVNANYE